MVRNRQTYALVALPLVVAVALLTLCLPVTCAMAGPMPVSCGNGNVPAPHAPTDTACKHQAVNAASANPEANVLLGSVWAVVQTLTLVTPPAVALLGPDAHASPPPGILLTASQLRI